MHLVMFDIDGTVVDSYGFDAGLFATAVSTELGVEVDETWRSYRHVTDSGILEQILAERLAEEDRRDAYERVKRRFVELVQDYVSRRPEGLTPILGAPGLLRTLRSMPGTVVAFATGGWRETAELKLRSARIEFAGAPFASASDARARAEIMQLAERKAASLGRFSRRTYFGDTPWDLQASVELGYDFVAVGNRVQHALQFDDLRDQSAVLGALGILRSAGRR